MRVDQPGEYSVLTPAATSVQEDLSLVDVVSGGVLRVGRQREVVGELPVSAENILFVENISLSLLTCYTARPLSHSRLAPRALPAAPVES